MKLLREIFTRDLNYSVDIVSKLIARIHDSEETVAVIISMLCHRP